MAFVQSFTANQSGDGTFVLITDTSNWVSESLNPADFVRQIIVKDADDNVINTYEFDGADLTLSYPIAVNQWQSITYTITGAFSATLTQKYPFEQIYRIAYVQQLTLNCGCCDKLIPMCDIDAFYQGAQFAVPIGDGISYNVNINSAYALLTGM